MKIRKTLISHILAGTLVLGIAGCKDFSDRDEYEYDGKIGENKIQFYQELEGTGDDLHYENTLRIERPDGKSITYIDQKGNDLKLEKVYTYDNGHLQAYEITNELDMPILEKAQKQFDDYLSQIEKSKLEERTNKVNAGLEFLE